MPGLLDELKRYVSDALAGGSLLGAYGVNEYQQAGAR